MSKTGRSGAFAVMALIGICGGCTAESGASLSAQQLATGQDPEVVSSRVLDARQLNVPGLGRPFRPARHSLPDGRRLVITQYTGKGDTEVANLAILELETKEVRRLTNYSPGSVDYVYAQRVSQNGRWIAFEWGTPGACCQLGVIRSDGTSERTLFSMGEDHPVDWAEAQDFSPDGTELLALVWAADGTVQLVRYSLQNEDQVILRAFDWRSPARAAFSPDGRFVAYDSSTDPSTSARELFLVSTNGEREVRLTNDSEPKLLIGWGENGQGLYYATPTVGGSSSVWRLPMNDGRPAGPPVRIRENLVNATEWTMSGGRLAYEIDTSKWQEVWTAAVDLQAGRFLTEPSLAVRDLPQGYSTFVWTPDRQTLVYTASLSPYIGQQLVLYSPGTGSAQVFPLPLSRVSASRWLDEHTWIGRGQARGRDEYVLFDLSTGRVSRLEDPVLLRQLEGYEGQDWPAFADRVNPIQSVDESLLYRRRITERGLEIVAVDVASGTERVISVVPGIESAANARPSPDGRHIAFKAGRNLYLLPPEGGEATVIFTSERPGGAVGWSADSRTIFTNEPGNPSRIWRIDVETRKAELSLTVPGAIQLIFNHDWTRLSILKLKEGPPLHELWVLENLPETRPAGRSPAPR